MEDITYYVNWALLALNVFLFLSIGAYILVKILFLRTDVLHWNNMAEHINSGKADDITHTIEVLHHHTEPVHNCGAHYFHKTRSTKSKFLGLGKAKKRRENLVETLRRFKSEKFFMTSSAKIVPTNE